MCLSVTIEVLHRPKKIEGRLSDLTHKKTAQKSWKYKFDTIHMLETEQTKEKGSF